MLPFFYFNRYSLVMVLLLLPLFLTAQWEYIQIDSTKQKWGDWAQPEWLRYFGLDAGDVNRDGCVDILSGRYVYHNPCGDMTGVWQRSVLDDNVDGILFLDVDDDVYADIIAMALPNIYWYEATNEEGTTYQRRRIAEVPATSHVNSQGFEKAQIITGGKPEILIAGNGNIYCIEVPESLDNKDNWPTNLICKNTSDEGIGFGDIDGDGDLDIAAGRRPEGEGEPLILVWFEHPGAVNQAWLDTEIGHSVHPIDRVEVVDLNGDQKADIVATEERYPGLEPDGNFYWFEQTADKAIWEKHIITTQYSMNNLDYADLDQDGDIDLITNEHKGPTLELQWWENDSNGNFTKHLIDTGKENHLGTQLVDLDYDGDLDIIGAAWDAYEYMHVWRNDQVQSSPRNGSVFREYPWAPTMVSDEGKFLRVGGKLHYATTPDHMPSTEHHKGAIPLPHDLDLENAVRAELILERVQSHEDTKQLEICFNKAPWLSIPDPPFISGKATDYMFHHSPVINIPLNHLVAGAENTFQFQVSEHQSWDWPQNLIYGLVLRIYYDESKTQSVNASLDLKKEENGIYAMKVPEFDPLRFDKVELVAHYQDVHRAGDGRYTDWQSYYHRGQLKNRICDSRLPIFNCRFNTSWLSEQTQPVKIGARLHEKNGLIHFQILDKTIELERDYEVHLLKPYRTPAFWVTRNGEYTQYFNLPFEVDQVTEAQLHWRSWSPCYLEGVLINGRTTNVGSISEKEKMPCYDYAAHQEDLQDLSLLQKGENILTTLKTPLQDGKMVHGAEIQWPGFTLKVKTKKQNDPTLKISEGTYQDRSHFVIHTPSATYYLDKAGGGFSRIIDQQGNDWVSYKVDHQERYPAAAASSFRGVPNLVFNSDDGGAGHPGFDKCTSEKTAWNVITVNTLSGKWQWTYTFYNDYVVLSVLKTDPEQAYWFLYEGTPGGSYAIKKQYYGTSKSGPSYEKPDFFKGESVFESYRWAYFGHQDTDRIIYLFQAESDQQKDILGYLGNSKAGMKSPDGMTVFGFGRGENTQPLLKGQNEFVIGFYPTAIKSQTDHEKLQEYLIFTFDK